jgi:hypothetical protein
MSTKQSASALDEASRPLSSIADKHLALVISTGIIIAFAIHIVFVSHGSPMTAVALIQLSSPTSVLLPLAATVLASTLAGALAIIGPSILCDPRTRPDSPNPSPYV